MKGKQCPHTDQPFQCRHDLVAEYGPHGHSCGNCNEYPAPVGWKETMNTPAMEAVRHQRAAPFLGENHKHPVGTRL